ncbi:MAG: ABC transporter substrate-binding protein [Acidimicrobiia bacterium]|nr:ABC transporter substrate-binding protein [Acidimicrobiia bacterium]MDH5615134.1 ABC transporter substrate-binding protein [Acidimicrobiia bacterium]
MGKKWVQVLALLAVLTLIAAACTQEDTEAFDLGVTEEPCPDGNPDNGCIYLGVISDLSDGPFAALAIPAVAGLQEFWNTVNAAGGVDGFDVAITAENTVDAHYNPTQHVEGYVEIEPNILMLAQSLGTPQTQAALPQYIEDNMVAVPATWWSGWAFPETDGNGLVLETGINYCLEGMNDVDFVVSQLGTDITYGIVGFPGDFGGDAAAGVVHAAGVNGLGDPAFQLVQVPLSAGGDVSEAVSQILANSPDVVFITTGPLELAQTMGGVFGAGGQAMFVGTHPSWNPGLVAQEALLPALKAAYFQSGFIPTWFGESAGHDAARAAAEAIEQSPNEWFLNGWASQYPVKALIEKAIGNGDLTRSGMATAVRQLDDVSFEGMLPNVSYVGNPNDVVPRQSIINRVDETAPGGTVTVTGMFSGPTAEAYDFSAPCFVP